MNNEESIFELIEQYHFGLLTQEERDKVELRMQSDTAFSDYVKFNGFANTVVHAAGIDLLRAQMSMDLIKIEQQRIRKKWKIGAGIIAALLGIATLFYFIKVNEKKKTLLPGNYQNNNTSTEGITFVNNNNNLTIPNTGTNKAVLNSSTPLNQEKEIGETPQKDQATVLTQTIADSSSKEEKVNEHREYSIKENNAKIDCALSFEAIVQLACKGERNGSIVVEQKNISGGTSPYSYTISGISQPSTTGLFYDLTKGNYIITVTDSKECSTSKEITVHEKNCTTKKSFSFNPDYGEKWETQVSAEKSGSFTIYNRAGIVFKNSNFSTNNVIEWDGTNSLGAPVEPGVYICTINYADGKTEIIELSIVR